MISYPCAIILSPPLKTIDSLKKVDGKEFYNALVEIMTYTNDAAKYFDSLQIKTISRTSIGSITFHTINNNDTIVNLSGFYWSILLFNGEDDPIHMGRSDFNMEVDNYMNIK